MRTPKKDSFQMEYTLRKLRKDFRNQIALFLAATGSDARDRAAAFLQDNAGTIFTGIHAEGDHRTIAYVLGWHIANVSGDYLVILGGSIPIATQIKSA